MSRSDDLTLPADRPITEREAEVVDWVLTNGALEDRSIICVTWSSIFEWSGGAHADVRLSTSPRTGSRREHTRSRRRSVAILAGGHLA